MPRILISESTKTGTHTANIFRDDGTLTLIGEALLNFLEDTDFDAVFDENEELVTEGISAVIEGDEGEDDEVHTVDEDVAALVAALEDGTPIELDEAGQYKAMSRSAVMKRMRNARIQTADEKMKARKSRMSRRRNKAKLKMARLKRQRRIGMKAERAAARRGLRHESTAADTQVEDVEVDAILVPLDEVDNIKAALAAAKLETFFELEVPDMVESDGSDLDDYMAFETDDAKLAEALFLYAAGAELFEHEEISNEALNAVGEAGESVVDMDDLAEMFMEYMDDMAESEDLRDRATVAAVAEALVESGACDGLDEAEVPMIRGRLRWKKGDFKKVHAGNLKTPVGKRTGPALVNSMLSALMFKGSIKRAGAESGYTKRGAGTPGKGYKGGDYVKDAEYGKEDGKRHAAWVKYVSGSKGEASQKKLAKATGKKKKKTDKKKALQKAAPKKVSGAALAKAKKAATAAKKFGKAKKGAKAEGEGDGAVENQLNEGTTTTQTNTPPKVINEGQKFAASLVRTMGLTEGQSRSVVESASAPAQPKPRVADSMLGMTAMLLKRQAGGSQTQARVRGMMEAAEPLVNFAKKLPIKASALGHEDYGVLYTPQITESDLRAWAKDVGFTRLNSNKMIHESLKDAQLVFLRDRMVVAPV